MAKTESRRTDDIATLRGIYEKMPLEKLGEHLHELLRDLKADLLRLGVALVVHEERASGRFTPFDKLDKGFVDTLREIGAGKVLPEVFWKFGDKNFFPKLKQLPPAEQAALANKPVAEVRKQMAPPVEVGAHKRSAPGAGPKPPPVDSVEVLRRDGDHFHLVLGGIGHDLTRAAFRKLVQDGMALLTA